MPTLEQLNDPSYMVFRNGCLRNPLTEIDLHPNQYKPKKRHKKSKKKGKK